MLGDSTKRYLGCIGSSRLEIVIKLIEGSLQRGEQQLSQTLTELRLRK